jgi:hypothetical protein
LRTHDLIGDFHVLLRKPKTCIASCRKSIRVFEIEVYAERERLAWSVFMVTLVFVKVLCILIVDEFINHYYKRGEGRI